ncbi:MAG: NADH-quinone oxidoreductase subunit C, partial [Streptosporangiaceae bacterium]|nr:NADH-quinone oxidoreductase subunit C [Streptosporangiaceae bacterium]
MTAQDQPPESEGNGGLPARLGEQRLSAPVVRRGMFGTHDIPDTSGYGLLQVRRPAPLSSP